MDEPLQTTPFNRAPRLQLPPVPESEVEIPAPPRTPDAREPNLLVTLIPVMGIGVMALLYLLRAFDSPNTLFSVIPLLFLAGFTIGGTAPASSSRIRYTTCGCWSGNGRSYRRAMTHRWRCWRRIFPIRRRC